jgi:hypothetical protein
MALYDIPATRRRVSPGDTRLTDEAGRWTGVPVIPTLPRPCRSRVCVKSGSRTKCVALARHYGTSDFDSRESGSVNKRSPYWNSRFLISWTWLRLMIRAFTEPRSPCTHRRDRDRRGERPSPPRNQLVQNVAEVGVVEVAAEAFRRRAKRTYHDRLGRVATGAPVDAGSARDHPAEGVGCRVNRL